MEKRQFNRILHRYVEGKSTEKEDQFIKTYYNLLLAKAKLDSSRDELKDKDIEREILDEIWERIREKEKMKSGLRIQPKIWKAVATIALLLGAGAVIYTLNTGQGRKIKTVAAIDQSSGTEGIKPGGNIAILTLNNGRKVRLDSLSNGALALQGNMNIVKLTSGQLSYKAGTSSGSRNQQVAFNTLTTPYGGQYEVVLPDGTKVWLNAASSLHYPVVFSGKVRTVEIKGEGYFEVAPDPQKPFIVKVGDDEKIEVLGTRFNVNSYSDEKEIRTTLQDGSVRVTGGEKSVLLKPSEAAGFDRETGAMVVGRANIKAVIAWKNGIFYFENTPIKEIMGQVSRWYKVKVVYETNELNHKIYSGTLPRYSDIDAVLKLLEMTGTVHFKINGTTITVLD